MVRSTSFTLLALGLVVGVGAMSLVARRRAAAAESLLAVGSVAPELEGPDQSGTVQQLSQTRGSPTVVYFYPMDETPGCTKEACAFRDIWTKFEQAHVKIFGVSLDGKESHAKFAAKYNLPFPLIADTGGVWAAAFGVPRHMTRFSRVSFLLDATGKVAKIYPDVDPGVHAAQVLADAQALAHR
jgi:peroxiredoxin Q/BCP